MALALARGREGKGRGRAAPRWSSAGCGVASEGEGEGEGEGGSQRRLRRIWLGFPVEGRRGDGEMGWDGAEQNRAGLGWATSRSGQ